jgi:hypothetical protein
LAFDSNLRHYSTVPLSVFFPYAPIEVGWCNLKPCETRVESAWYHRWRLTYDDPLSSSSYNCKVRRYMSAHRKRDAARKNLSAIFDKVGQKGVFVCDRSGAGDRELEYIDCSGGLRERHTETHT